MYVFKGFTTCSSFSSCQYIWYNTDNNRYYITTESPETVAIKKGSIYDLIQNKPPTYEYKKCLIKDSLSQPCDEISVETLKKAHAQRFRADAILRFHPVEK